MRFSSDEINRMSNGDFFGEGNAQLPSSLMLMLDEIHEISSEGGVYNRGMLEASFAILPDHWFFAYEASELRVGLINGTKA